MQYLCYHKKLIFWILPRRKEDWWKSVWLPPLKNRRNATKVDKSCLSTVTYNFLLNFNTIPSILVKTKVMTICIIVCKITTVNTVKKRYIYFSLVLSNFQFVLKLGLNNYILHPYKYVLILLSLLLKCTLSIFFFMLCLCMGFWLELQILVSHLMDNKKWAFGLAFRLTATEKR